MELIETYEDYIKREDINIDMILEDFYEILEEDLYESILKSIDKFDILIEDMIILENLPARLPMYRVDGKTIHLGSDAYKSEITKYYKKFNKKKLALMGAAGIAILLLIDRLKKRKEKLNDQFIKIAADKPEKEKIKLEIDKLKSQEKAATEKFMKSYTKIK